MYQPCVACVQIHGSCISAAQRARRRPRRTRLTTDTAQQQLHKTITTRRTSNYQHQRNQHDNRQQEAVQSTPRNYRRPIATTLEDEGNHREEKENGERDMITAEAPTRPAQDPPL